MGHLLSMHSSTTSKATAEQQDIVALLKRNGFNRRRLDAVAKCDATRCGDTAHCREICAFGRERRKLNEGQSIALLLADHTELFEVRVSRARWSCGLSHLDPATIRAVNTLNRRALDKIQELCQSSPSARSRYLRPRQKTKKHKTFGDGKSTRLSPPAHRGLLSKRCCRAVATPALIYMSVSGQLTI